MMKKSLLALAVSAAITVPATSSATTMAELEAQMEQMKAQIAEMKATQGSSSGAADWTNNVTLNGEIQMNIAEGGAGSLGDVVLETTIQATENTTGYIKLKSAGDGAAPTVDEATITHDFGIAAVRATTGGHPFGDYSSNMISDPLTKELGDIGGSAKIIAEVPVGDNLTLVGAVDDDIHTFAATFEMDELTIGLSHINKLTGSVSADAPTKSANNLFVSYSIGDLSLIAETVDSDGTSDATNIEAAYGFSIAGHDAGVAVGRSELKNDTAKEKRNMFSSTINIDEGLDFTVEHLDSDINTSDAWSAQIAYGF
jgi:hypothetical protein